MFLKFVINLKNRVILITISFIFNVIYNFIIKIIKWLETIETSRSFHVVIVYLNEALLYVIVSY